MIMTLRKTLTTTLSAALAAGAILAPATLVSAQETPGEGIEVKPAYGVLGELFQTEIVNIGLEELGYEIEDPAQIEYATMHIAVGNGELDFSPAHWRELHTTFYEEGGGDETMDRLGTLVDDVLQGYLIDKATAEENEITTIDQMNDPEIAALFDSDGDGAANLTGCNPGWGCELVIEHHLEAYELTDAVQHDQGKYDALIANTITRYEQGEPIFYYTWTPYWVGGVLTPGEDVVWLEVPFTSLPGDEEVSEEATSAEGLGNLGFATDRQQIVANLEFLEANPAAAQFFEAIQIPIDDINAQNLLMQEGEDSEADIRGHAEEWVADNREQFDTWLEEARAAAN